MTYSQYFNSLSVEELDLVIVSLRNRLKEVTQQEREDDRASLLKLYEMATAEYSNRIPEISIG
jgi:hypothetical protein